MAARVPRSRTAPGTSTDDPRSSSVPGSTRGRSSTGGRDTIRSASTTSPTPRRRDARFSTRSASTRRRSPARRIVRARCYAACPSGSSAASGSRPTGKRTNATWRSTSRGSATCRWRWTSPSATTSSIRPISRATSTSTWTPGTRSSRSAPSIRRGGRTTATTSSRGRARR